MGPAPQPDSRIPLGSLAAGKVPLSARDCLSHFTVPGKWFPCDAMVLD